MDEKGLIKRHRNVAHLWADKRVIRFFRKAFDKNHYKNLRSVYLALCEIDSDFGEGTEIRGFTKTVSTYAGMNEDTIRPYLRALQKANIIDYEQLNVDGQFGGTSLFLYAWEESEEDQKTEIIHKVLSNRMQRTREPAKTRPRENPGTVNPGNGKTGSYKNNTKVLSTNKNPKGSNNQSMGTTQLIDDDSPKKEIPPSTDKIIEMYHNYCPSLPRVMILTEKRRKAINTRLKKFPLTTLRKAFQKAEASEFLSGRNGAWKGCNFDWLINENNLVKVLEGKYENNHPTESSPILPQKLIKKHFPNDTLRKAFLRSCYKPAKILLEPHLNGKGNGSDLAGALLTLHSQIEEEQSKKLPQNLRSLMPGPMTLVEMYIGWIGEQHWVDNPQVKMFDIRDGRFARFRRDQAKADNQERDPITGRSYLRE